MIFEQIQGSRRQNDRQTHIVTASPTPSRGTFQTPRKRSGSVEIKAN